MKVYEAIAELSKMNPQAELLWTDPIADVRFVEASLELSYAGEVAASVSAVFIVGDGLFAARMLNGGYKRTTEVTLPASAATEDR